ncbi:MAG TPA: membrane protein insertase YidC [bacterium]|nr:membrane protein insertase YidC [bacterium]
MENNNRFVLFIVSAFLILFAWSYFFPNTFNPPDQASNAVSQTAPVTGANPGMGNPPAASAVSKPIHVQKTNNVHAASVTIETDNYIAVFSNEGAVLTHFQLKKYPNRETHQPIELVNPDPSHPKPFSLSYEPIPDLNQKMFEMVGSSKKLSKPDDKAGLTFRYVDGSGRVLEKDFSFKNGTYLVDFNVTVSQAGGGSTPASSLAVEWADTLGQEESTGTSGSKGKYQSSRYGGYRVATLSPSGVDFERPKGSQESTEIANATWTGLANQFFTAVMIPDPSTGGASAKVVRDYHAYQAPTDENPNPGEDPKSFNPRPELVFAGQALKSGESFKRNIKVFFGPQEYQLLKGLGLDPVMDLGTFGFIAVYLLKLLQWLDTWCHSWGLAVILLSIAVKLALWLPTHNSYKNMSLTQKKMKEVQPRMDALKRKYPNDPQKQREEQAKLFQEAGINPLGGCLPLFLQIPVIYALYAALGHSIELRGAGFLWLKDLTQNDPIYVLPLLVGVTMILQQKVSGQMATQTTGQQKMMMWMMPVVLTFISTKWPSGLLLYWVVTNVLSMVQQKVVNREIQHAKKKVEESKS